MLLASDYPFKHIVGVEYSPGLHAIAVNNIKKYASKAQRCTSFELVLGDALDYELPRGPVICLVFNSFDPPTMRQVLGNFDAQVATRTDPVFMIYTNLRSVTEIGETIHEGRNFQTIYESDHEIVLCNSSALALWRAPIRKPIPLNHVFERSNK